MRLAFVGTIALAGCDVFFPLTGPPPDAPKSDAPGSDAAPAACATSPDYQVGFGVSTYRFVTESARWADAELTCELDGAHLAAPEANGEIAFLRSVLVSNGINEPAWVGVARDSTADGTNRQSFRRVTGGTQGVSWQDQEPTNGSTLEYAATIDPGQDLVDVTFTNNHMFVCECDGKARTEFFDFE